MEIVCYFWLTQSIVFATITRVGISPPAILYEESFSNLGLVILLVIRIMGFHSMGRRTCVPSDRGLSATGGYGRDS